MSTPHFTLYRADGACSVVAHILLEKLNLSYNSVLVKPTLTGAEALDGSFNSDQYKAIHPYAYVPALKVTAAGTPASSDPLSIGPNDTVITENPAILAYIVSFKKDNSWLGDNAIESAQITSWTTWLSGTVHGAGYGAFLRPQRYAGPAVPGATDKVRAIVKEGGRRKIIDSYEVLENRIGEDGYLVGGKLTVADFYALWFWFMGRKVLGEDMSQFVKWTKGVRHLKEISEVKKVFDDEGQGAWLDV